jgi:hypothetical protein
MEKMIHRNPKYLGRVHELLFSAYFSLLFVGMEESRPFAWTTRGRFLYFWHPHAVGLRLTDFLLFYLELFLIPAVAMFLCLLVMRRFSFTRALLRRIGGILAVAGFPLVCMYSRGTDVLLLEVSLPMSAICFVLWVYGKWPVSTPVNICLLVLYYTLCVLFSGGPHSSNWGWARGIWEYLYFVYPTVGFCYTIVWAAYFRQSESSELHSSPVTVE